MWFLHMEQLGLPHSMAVSGQSDTRRLTSSRLNTLVDSVEAMFDDLALKITWCCFHHILGDSHKSPSVSKTGNIDSIS